MSKEIENLIGKRYGRWKVIDKTDKKKGGEIYWLCRCDCGTIRIVMAGNLRSGKSKSCGCLQREIASENRKKYNRFINREDFIVGFATNTNREFYLDAEDYLKIKDYAWYESNAGYMMNKTGDKMLLLHRYIVDASEGTVIDHINHNPMDNRKKNLKITTQQINSLNRTMLPNGITKHKVGNNIYFRVQLGGRYRGNYKTYEEAKKKRDEIISIEYLPLRSYI